jgi:hypothetical protein
MIAKTAMQACLKTRTRSRRQWSGGLVATMFASLALMLTMVAPLVPSTSAEEWSAPRTVYIAETGQSLDQVFLDVWRDGNGAESFGYPITPEIEQDNGHVVQYFQYARFEYWPEGDANGQHFHIGNVGEELRPISVQRSIATWNSTGSPSQSARSEESLSISKAWLPVTALSVLNTADRFVEESRHSISGGFLDFWVNTGEAAFLGNPITEEYASEGMTYQVFEKGQLVRDEGGEVRMIPVGQILADKYGLDQSPVAQGDLPTYSEDLFIPPPPPEPAIGGGYVAGAGEVWVDINLSAQYMMIFQGDTMIGDTYISSGRPGFDTPTGTFFVQSKYEADDMEGVLGGEYYNVPQVPDVLYFTNGGHAIHGTYWHNNFGAVMSHGCVNVPMGTADWLYSIAPIGMRIVIHY